MCTGASWDLKDFFICLEFGSWPTGLDAAGLPIMLMRDLLVGAILDRWTGQASGPKIRGGLDETAERGVVEPHSVSTNNKSSLATPWLDLIQEQPPLLEPQSKHV